MFKQSEESKALVYCRAITDFASGKQTGAVELAHISEDEQYLIISELPLLDDSSNESLEIAGYWRK